MNTSGQRSNVTATPQLKVGQIVAERYILERELQETSAGVLFEARRLSTQRHVALELATMLRDDDSRARYERDAVTAQRLEGEHIVHVLDVGELPTGVPFVAREPVVTSLSNELRSRGPIPIEEAVGWTLEACEAVAEAHAIGIAHGDIRPGTVFLARRNGQPSVVKVEWTTVPKATGKARGDVRTDIAALGRLVLRLVTGPDPEGKNGAPTLPSDLAYAIGRAMTTEGETPFDNVAEFACALAPLAAPGHPSARNAMFLLSRAGILKARPPRVSPSPAPVLAADLEGVEEAPSFDNAQRVLALAIGAAVLLGFALAAIAFLFERAG